LACDNQEGVRSIGCEPGPYSRISEAGVMAFVEGYCETMERALGAGERASGRAGW